MLNNEAEIGATLHWIVDPGVGTGPEIGSTTQHLTKRRLSNFPPKA